MMSCEYWHLPVSTGMMAFVDIQYRYDVLKIHDLTSVCTSFTSFVLPYAVLVGLVTCKRFVRVQINSVVVNLELSLISKLGNLVKL